MGASIPRVMTVNNTSAGPITRSDDSPSDDRRKDDGLANSMLLGYAFNDGTVGGLLGGNMLGGMIGDALNGGA